MLVFSLVLLGGCGANGDGEGTIAAECEDLIDNDFDGLVDCADDGCSCSDADADADSDSDTDTDSDTDADSDTDVDTDTDTDTGGAPTCTTNLIATLPDNTVVALSNCQAANNLEVASRPGVLPPEVGAWGVDLVVQLGATPCQVELDQSQLCGTGNYNLDASHTVTFDASGCTSVPEAYRRRIDMISGAYTVTSLNLNASRGGGGGVLVGLEGSVSMQGADGTTLTGTYVVNGSVTPAQAPNGDCSGPD